MFDFIKEAQRLIGYYKIKYGRDFFFHDVCDIHFETNLDKYNQHSGLEGLNVCGYTKKEEWKIITPEVEEIARICIHQDIEYYLENTQEPTRFETFPSDDSKTLCHWRFRLRELELSEYLSIQAGVD